MAPILVSIGSGYLLEPPTGRTVPFDQGLAALGELETSHTPRAGKLVLVMD